MLRLMLLRHAKAEPGAAMADHQRALNALGIQQAQALGRYMAVEGLVPDLILASDALRTHQTAQEILLLAGGDAPLKLDLALYVAHPRTLLEAVHATPASVRALLLVGHNPGLAELADALTGYGDRYAAARMRQKYPPSGLCVLDFDMETWQEIAIKTGRLDRYIVPADIGVDAGE